MTKAEAEANGWRWWARKPTVKTLRRTIPLVSPLEGTAKILTQVATKRLQRAARAVTTRYTRRVTSAIAAGGAAAGKKAAAVIASALPTVGSAAIGIGTTAAAAAVALAAGYFIGMAVRPETTRLSRELRQQAIDQAYRVARRQLAERLKRPATLLELKPLTAAWKEATVRNVAGELQSRGRVY